MSFKLVVQGIMLTGLLAIGVAGCSQPPVDETTGKHVQIPKNPGPPPGTPKGVPTPGSSGGPPRPSLEGATN